MGRKRFRPRLASPEAIAAIVARIEHVEKFPSRQPVDEALWVLVVGKVVAMRTRPLKLQPDGSLLVRTASAAWSQELSLLEPAIRSKLEEKGVRVERLRFQVGSVAPITTPFEIAKVTKALPRQPIPAALATVLADVDDEELRVAIGGALERRLGG